MGLVKSRNKSKKVREILRIWPYQKVMNSLIGNNEKGKKSVRF